VPDDLKLLRGAIRARHEIQALRHIRLYDGRAQASDASIAIDVPFECGGLDVTVPASEFASALEICDAPEFKMMASGRLQVKQGGFKASLPLFDNLAYPKSAPDGDKYEPGDGLLEAFATARPFTGDLKAWTKGVSIREGYVYATNGMSLVRVKVDVDEAIRITVPESAVSELVRIGLPITALRVSETSCTFKLGAKVWLRAQLISEEAPDMSKMIEPCDTPVPEGLREAVDKLAPFFEGPTSQVKLDENGVHAVGATEAVIAIPNLPDSIFQSEGLREVLALAKYINLNGYPQKCDYNDGERVSGAIVGVRV